MDGRDCTLGAEHGQQLKAHESWLMRLQDQVTEFMDRAPKWTTIYISVLSAMVGALFTLCIVLFQKVV